MADKADEAATSANLRRITLRGVGYTTDRPPPDGAGPLGNLHEGMIVAGKFALVRVLAEDSITQTFEAEDTLAGRRVALRVMKPDHALNAEAARRFRREAHAAAVSAHPSARAVLEVGRRSDGSLYVVHELLTGPTLAEHLRDRGALPEAEALALVRPIAGALATAHAQGVVHRDVNPSNIVLCKAPFAPTAPKLLGYRGARQQTSLTDARYLAPEQTLADGFVDARADVWALGAVLYETLTGRTRYEDAQRGVRLEQRPSEMRGEVAALVSQCLERDADRRPDMRVLYTRLGRLCDEGPPASGDRDLDAHTAPNIATELSDADIEEGEEAEFLDVDPDDDDEAPPAVRTRSIEVEATGRASDWIRATSQVESEFAKHPTSFAAPPSHLGAIADATDRAADAAQRALRLNSLDEAVVHAEAAIATGHATGELLGQVQLVRTIAEYWLGRYDASERGAQEALASLPDGSPGWFGALGHLALTRARVGRFDAVSDLDDAPDSGSRAGAAQMIAVCRRAVSIVRAGALARARQLVRVTRDRLDRSVAQDDAVHAWLDVAFAERAAFVGDIARELPRRVSAIERFTAAGDVRNACDQRVHAGAVVLRLGAFDEAERILHEALGIAEPMRLATASVAKAYLGFAAFRQGEAERAHSLARDALEEIQTHGDRHSEALCSSLLALIHALREEVDEALAAAQNAVASAEPFPALLSQALGVHAATLLVAGRAQLALAPAERAMDLLADNGGAGEGESLTRLTHALVLAQSGETAASRKSMKAARDRIVGLAERLSDPRYKKSFLDRISENARILQLGGEWLDEAVSTPGGTR